MKTIRLPMQSMESFLARYPNLQVIHLVRDPRATMNSEIEAGNGQWRAIESISAEFCQNVLDDIISASELSKKFKNRIMRVRYEDIVFNPFPTTRKMYAFGRLKYTAHTDDFLSVEIYGENIEKFMTSKYKQTGIKRSSQWRKVVSFSNAGIIDRNCEALYQYLGYRAVQNQELYNNVSYNLFEPMS